MRITIIITVLFFVVLTRSTLALKFTKRFKRDPSFHNDKKFNNSIYRSVTKTVFDDISSEQNDEKVINSTQSASFEYDNDNEITKRSRIEDSIKNFNTESDGALIVIDVNGDSVGTENPDKKSSISQKHDSEIYDGRGFSIVLDNNGESEEDQPGMKDKIYDQMQSVYRDMEHEFTGIVKEPKDQKKVHVIVITPKLPTNENAISRDVLPQPAKNQNNKTEALKESIVLSEQNPSSGENHSLINDPSRKSELDIDIDKLKHVKEKLKLLNEDDDKVSDGLSEESNLTKDENNSKDGPTKPVHKILKIHDDDEPKYSKELLVNDGHVKLDSSSLKEAERQLNTLNSYSKLINNDDITKEYTSEHRNVSTLSNVNKIGEERIKNNVNINMTDLKENNKQPTSSGAKFNHSEFISSSVFTQNNNYAIKINKPEIRFIPMSNKSIKQNNSVVDSSSHSIDFVSDKNNSESEPTVGKINMSAKQTQNNKEMDEIHGVGKQTLKNNINNISHTTIRPNTTPNATTAAVASTTTTRKVTTTSLNEKVLHEQATTDNSNDRKHEISKYVRKFLFDDVRINDSKPPGKGEKYVIKFDSGKVKPPDNPRPNAAQIIETTPSIIKSTTSENFPKTSNLQDHIKTNVPSHKTTTPEKLAKVVKTHQTQDIKLEENKQDKLIEKITLKIQEKSNEMKTVPTTRVIHPLNTQNKIVFPANNSFKPELKKPEDIGTPSKSTHEAVLKTNNEPVKPSHEVKTITSKSTDEIPEQDVYKTPTPRGFGNESPVPSKNIKTIDKRKAEAIIEFLNKDPLESWRYKFTTLKSLDLNSTILRSGLVNAGNIERLKGVMKRALEGKDITLSVVGGSISAGGGLYKDMGNIDGLYYKGVADWWNKMISPLTGSEMKVNNIAIGSIGTDYFSYCIKNHISKKTDIVLWELAANDYNRYKMQPTKGARPLERLTRMILELPKKPALMYVNFFKGVDYKASRESCPNFEDQGEDIIAHYYKIPSLSWRAMVCGGLVRQEDGFKIDSLFSQDQYHPSLRGHAQMSLLLLLHLRHVMRAVLQSAIAHDGFIDKFEEQYILPEPLFIGPKSPEPLCWTLITADMSEQISNTLSVRINDDDGFKLEYATNFPIRFDKVICWKAEKPYSQIALQFFIPENYGPTDLKRLRSEIAITTHTRWGGSATMWIDDMKDKAIVIKEGRPNDPGKRTQVDSIANDIPSGSHTLNIKAHDKGFCLSSIMVDGS